MKLNLYSVYDKRIKRLNMPFPARSDEEAKIIVSRSGIPDVVLPDVQLFCIAAFDDEVCQDFREIDLPSDLKGGDNNV